MNDQQESIPGRIVVKHAEWNPSLRDYLIAHAPPVPDWFEPRLSMEFPTATLPNTREISKEAAKEITQVLNGLREKTRVDGLVTPEAIKFAEERSTLEERHRVYRQHLNLARASQWPVAWADAVIEEGKR